MEKANGQMLFQYRASLAEYQELKGLFAERLRVLNGVPWRFGGRAECALFVLFASEWWRREYEGGAWRWTSIFQSLTTDPYRVDPIDRSEAIERGLRAWGHRPSDDGKKYLGAIVAQGGLPLKMIARGDGVASRLLLSATRKAQLLGWEEHQLLDFFEAHADEMVQHLRAKEIYRLLAGMVTTVLALRRDYPLAETSNPVMLLDQTEPRWRERFPISVDDQSIEPLLIGLVREAARQARVVTAYPVAVTRTLVQKAEADCYELSMEVQLASTMSVDGLATAMEVPPARVPQSFVLEMVGSRRIPLGQGRQLFGAQVSAVLLTGKLQRFFGAEACREVLLALRSVGSDIVSPTSVPRGEALDESQPWCFASMAGALTLIGVGSCKVADDTAYLLMPDRFKISALDDATVEIVGLVEDLPESRRIYKIQGAVDILADDETYRVRTDAHQGGDEQMVWKGSRLWSYSSPFPVFQGVPRLYRLDIEGQPHAIPDKDIEWVQAVPKGDPLLNVKTHRGPADAWLRVEGKRHRRFRMVLVAANARIAFKSGASECEGSIEFHGWGVKDLHTAAVLSPECFVDEGLACLSMRAEGQPPSTVSVTAEWSPAAMPVLRVDLPFPATGGRFTRSDGSVLANGAALPIKRIHNVRVQVFDRNPNAPKQYRLEMHLQGDSQGSRLRHAEIDVPLDANGVGELRFFEIESILGSLFCQSDHLDACLNVSLLVGSTATRTLRLTRYDLELEHERELKSLAIPGVQLVDVAVEQLQGIQLLAIPLLERMQTPYDLEPLRTGEAPVGRWSVAHLPSGHSPWLIYPSENSSLQVRPTLWSTSAFDLLGTIETLGDRLCPLAKAMSSSIPEDRTRDLVKVVEEMTADFDHLSWKLMAHHYQQIRHLPLNTLDYWRVIGRSQDACLAAVLKLPGDLNELMSRMRDELGVMWEFTSRMNLQTAYDALTASLTNQLGEAVNTDLISQLSNGLFTKMGLASEPLGVQIDRILFEKTGERSARFDRLITDFQRTPSALLQHHWRGEDSLLQRVLLRNHAEQRIWPYFKLTEELLKQIQGQHERQYVSFLTELGKDLLWMPSASAGGPSINAKGDVANAPLLTGYLIQICDANQWLQSKDFMAALRQIKAFDPVWFELGVQTGALLAMKAAQQHSQACRGR